MPVQREPKAIKRLILRVQLWLAERRESRLLDESESHFADSQTYRRLVEVGSRVNVLRGRLTMMDGRGVHP